MRVINGEIRELMYQIIFSKFIFMKNSILEEEGLIALSMILIAGDF